MVADMADRTPNASLAPVIAALVPERFVLLEQAQVVLLARLHNRPDDFSATTELQAMNALSARLKAQIPPLERDRLVQAGLSSVERTRIWLRSKARSRGGAETTVAAAGPCPEAPTTTAARRGVVGGASPAPPRRLAATPMVSKKLRRGGHLHAGRGAAMTTRRVQ
jgi:hypothetical protein